MPRVFSSQLKATLRSFYPQQNAQTCPYFGHPADTFVEHILSAAGNAAADMMRQEFNVTKQELRAEQKDVLKSLKAMQDKLRKLSLPFHWLLEDGAAPLKVADSLDTIIHQIEATVPGIDALPQKMRANEDQHNIAVEMTFRVLHVLKDNGIKVAATSDPNFGYTSVAVSILKAIGDDIGLVLKEITWRDRIIEVKQSDPDL